MERIAQPRLAVYGNRAPGIFHQAQRLLGHRVKGHVGLIGEDSRVVRRAPWLDQDDTGWRDIQKRWPQAVAGGQGRRQRGGQRGASHPPPWDASLGQNDVGAQLPAQLTQPDDSSNLTTDVACRDSLAPTNAFGRKHRAGARAMTDQLPATRSLLDNA